MMFKSFLRIFRHKGAHHAFLNCLTVCVLLWQPAQSLLHAQDRPGSDLSDYNELYKFVLGSYGVDQVLSNGVLYTDMYLIKEGHQFLGEDRLYTGSLVFRGRQYEGLGMKYDVCNQQLIVFLQTEPIREGIILPLDFTSAFSLEGRSFTKSDFQGEPLWYQVVFDNDRLKCLYHWSKKVMETAGGGNYKYSHFEFSNSKRQSYLFINGSFELYRNNRTFIDLFPQEVRAGLGHFMKTNRLKVSAISDEKMSELMTYCNTLIK